MHGSQKENVQVKSSSTGRKTLKWFKNLTREIPDQFPIRVKDFAKQTKWLEGDWKFKTIKKSSGLELVDSQPSNPGIVIRPRRLTNDPIHIEIASNSYFSASTGSCPPKENKTTILPDGAF